MNGLKKYLVISGILLVLYLIAQYYKPKPTDWTPSYLVEDKIPFGTYILYQQIQDIFPGAKVEKSNLPIYNALKNRQGTGANYLIVSSVIKADNLDSRALLQFIKKGNHVFIAAFQIQCLLPDTLQFDIASDFDLQVKRKTKINFENPILKKEYGYLFDRGTSQQYFSAIDTSKAIVIGKNAEGKANFIQYKIGKGSLLISPNPQLFNNYSLLKPDGADYAAKALSYLPKTKTLIWDEHFTRPITEDQSPLRLIFKYDQLRWAYLISLIGLVAFVLFEIKRRQRIIPVISRPTNTSVEFAQTVGRVYYQQRNNRDIATKKISYLLDHIRNKYRIKTLILDTSFISHLGQVSGVAAETLNQLFTLINMLQNVPTLSDQDLIALNNSIEQFYKEDQ